MQHLKAASHPGETGDLSNVPSFKEGIKVIKPKCNTWKPPAILVRLGILSNVPSFKKGIKPTIQQLKEHATNGIVRFLIEWAGLLWLITEINRWFLSSMSWVLLFIFRNHQKTFTIGQRTGPQNITLYIGLYFGVQIYLEYKRPFSNSCLTHKLARLIFLNYCGCPVLLKYILGQYDVTCLLSKKMRCCEYNPAEKELKECLFRAADWCGFHQSTATGAQKKTSQNLPMLSSVTFYCEKLSKLSTSVKFVEKNCQIGQKISKNCQKLPNLSQNVMSQSTAGHKSSHQYVPKAKGGSVLSCMYYCTLCLGKR